MNHRKHGILVAIVAALALCAPGALADDHEGAKKEMAAPYRMVHHDHLDPSKSEAFEAQQREWVAAFTKAEAGEEWTWWVFQNGFDFVTAWAFPDFAELDKDGDAMMEEVVGKETLAKLTEPTGAVLKHHNVIIKHNAEISYDAGDVDPANPGDYFNASTYWIRPGSEERFMEMTRKIKAAFEKTKQPHSYNIWNIVAGEGSFVVTGFADSAADYYSRPKMRDILTEAYGAEETQKIFAEWREIAVDQEHKDYMFRVDLSYMPGAMKKAGK